MRARLKQSGAVHRAPRKTMDFDPAREILDTWKTNHRVTVFLVRNIPANLWPQAVPAWPRRTVRRLACHLHNSRCMWIKMVGRDTVSTPPKVDLEKATPKQLISALERSNKALLNIFEASFANNGRLPAVPAWMNVQPEVVHFMAYLVSHEAHHRGQILLIARQLGHRLPDEARYGLWQWKTRAKEGR